MVVDLSKEYLGKGFDFPFAFTKGGSTAGATYEEKVKLNMVVILSTQTGSRFMEPDVGSNLKDYIFEPDDFITYSGIKNAIITALSNYVPVVEVLDVLIDVNKKKDNYVPIIVKFKFRYNNEVSNLVYPFYKPEIV